MAISRLAGAARAADPVSPSDPIDASISVVIPARDEADRIGPLLERIVGAPGVAEVIVVDDQSSDATAAIASAAGASVISGAAPSRRLGRQGVGAPAGNRGGHERVGRHARRRRPARSPAPDRRRGPSAARRRRIPDRRRTLRMPDPGHQMAPRIDADHARVPVRAPRISDAARPGDGERSMHDVAP